MIVGTKKINVMYLRSGVRDSDVLLGADAVVLNIAKNLDKKIFSPLIVYMTDDRQQQTPLLDEAIKNNIMGERVNLGYKFDVPGGFHQIKKIIKKNEVDLVHCQEYKSNLMGFLVHAFMGIPVITTAHGWVGCNWKVKLYETIDAFVIRFFAKIIAVSKGMEEVLKKKKVPVGKIKVIYNGIDEKEAKVMVTDATVSAYKKKLSIPPDACVVGTVGRLSVEKGQDDFIRAAAEVLRTDAHVYFIVIGDGPYRDELKKLMRKLSLEKQIIFTGFQKNIPVLLAVMDIFVLPSRRETFGLVLLEAFFMEKPVVCTPVGIAGEIVVDGKNALLSKVNDSKSMSQAILKLVKDKTFAAQLGGNAYQSAKECFSAEEMAQQYAQLYAEMIIKKDD
ncbi:MAG: glycosyltransferase family 4 protein [Ignavibacteriales bacterium]|nr:glycosyltransferase family 4 protein [Ignavibacteriales bacterium]